MQVKLGLFLRLVAGVFLMVTIQFAWAQAASQPAGFAFLPPYPNAEREAAVTRSVPDYRLILGQLSIVGNQVRSPEERLSGELTRLTYRIPSGHTSQSAFKHYRAELEAAGATILFSCTSRDCGRSSEWASDIFKIANLYGIDREQNYLAARLEQNSRTYYVALYTIMRGNQRVYAHADVVETDASANGGTSASSLPRTLVPLRNGDFAVSLPDALAGFVKAASEDSNKNIWVVVHTSGESFEAAATRGKAVGERVKLWLISRGLAGARVETLAVGPLAPPHSPTVPADRVELFLLD